MPHRFFVLALASALLVSAPLSAQSRLWIVSTSGCPNVDFAQIQPAVDAAADGDVILVRSVLGGGVYAGFGVTGKSLAIVAATPNDVRVAGVLIQGLTSTQSVLLQGFADLQFLTLTSNAGPVWIEDSKVFGLGIASSTVPPPPAASVLTTSSVIFNRCTIAGGASYTIGGIALSVDQSLASLYDCTVYGGMPGLNFSYTGGTGLSLQQGTVFLGGTSVTGGQGGFGFSDLRCSQCTPGGPGGTGLSLGSSGAIVYALGGSIEGGAGGPSGCGCPIGPKGTATTGPGVLHVLPGVAHSFNSNSPVREGEAVSLTYTGQAGDVAQLFVSAAQQHRFFWFLNGTLAPQLPGISAVVGILPPSGTLSFSAAMPPVLVSPGRALVVYDQGLYVGGSSAYLGSGKAWVILDAALDPFDGCPTVVYVDDDAPGDPGPGNPAISNPLENGSLAAPFDAIQEGIDAAVDGATVIVRDGTYSGEGNQELQFKQRNITVRSENGPAACVISVGPTKNGFFYPFTPTQNVPSLVDGFTITGAQAAFYITGGAATVRNCRVIANQRGFEFYNYPTPLIDRCVIAGNMTLGTGAGVHCYWGSPTLRDCVIVDNTSAEGSGVYVGDSSGGVTLLGCTLAGNVATTGAAITVDSGAVTTRMTDCIVFDNIGTEQIAVIDTRATLDVRYCDIEGGREAITLARMGITTAKLVWGPGNFTADPLFVDALHGDYHIALPSPCRNTGDPSFTPAPGETDIDGEARVFGPAVDVGADEIQQ